MFLLDHKSETVRLSMSPFRDIFQQDHGIGTDLYSGWDFIFSLLQRSIFMKDFG